MKLVILTRHSPDNIEVKLNNSVGRQHSSGTRKQAFRRIHVRIHVPPYVKYSMQYITGIVH